MLEALCYPSDSATNAPYPFMDRWGDSWNVTAEMVILNQARSLGALSFLAAQTSLKTQPWKSVAGQINVPASVRTTTPITLSLTAPGIDLSSARITWETIGSEPCFGQTCTMLPKSTPMNVQAEALLPDGRRIFAKTTITTNNVTVTTPTVTVSATTTNAARIGLVPGT